MNQLCVGLGLDRNGYRVSSATEAGEWTRATRKDDDDDKDKDDDDDDDDGRGEQQRQVSQREIIYFWEANNPCMNHPQVHIPFHTRTPLSRFLLSREART